MNKNKSPAAAADSCSAQVSRESTVLDLEQGVFSWKDAKKIALPLKHSADSSARRKAEPFRCAMSMLVFYINHAGSKLDAEQKQILQQARDELRKLYGRC